MSALALRTRWLVSDSLVLARRNLEHVRQIPEKLLDVTLQPIMFVLLFTYVFGGVMARTPDAVQGFAFMTVFPLTFLSNAFVPAQGLPDGLQQIAEWNPVSAVVTAVRTLFGNPTALPADAPWPLQHPVIAAVLWSIAILAVAAPLCVALFKRRTTG